MPTFDIKALEENFKLPAINNAFDSLYQCLGTITAIASSPDKVKPSEWIKLLITVEDENPQFENQQQAKTFSSHLIAWWSQCLDTFDKGETIELPAKLGLTPSGKANKALVDFATGYLKGYDWLSKTWQVMLPKDNLEAERSLSVVNFILARFINEKAVAKAQPELFQQLPDNQGCFKTLPSLLSAVGMLGTDLSAGSDMDLKSDGKISTQIDPTRHVGRNSPCICGSGKKFKKCCLH